MIIKAQKLQVYSEDAIGTFRYSISQQLKDIRVGSFILKSYIQIR